ncbi:MAG: lysophospholipase [Verrucomicrobia bacterium]|nr:lysophospholipase [Verrucomicrobiota bacterium]
MRAVLAALLCVGQAIAGEPLPGLPESPRLLFQGDSITDGNRGRGADLNHVHGHGFVYLLAARIGAGAPGQQATFFNRGISGNTVVDLSKRWAKDALELKPDVLSVLIGVNDSSKGITPEVFEKTYDELLTAARAANPKLRLVLCVPFLGASGPAIDKAPGRRERLALLVPVVRRLAAKHDATLVDFQKVFDEAQHRAPSAYWIWDGVHPTTAGHQLMADEWEKVVRASWR